MRIYFALMTATALAACGGQGAQTVGSAGSTPPGGSSGGSSDVPVKYSDFTNLVREHTYTGVGGSQTYAYKVSQGLSSQFGQLYAGNATTISDSATTVSYSARDGIYTLTTTDAKSTSSIVGNRFQDPAHRVDFDLGIPDLTGSNVRYVASGLATNVPYTDGGSFQETTLFYQVPGSGTKYVSFAGFQRLNVSTASVTDPGATVAHLENTVRVDRGAFAYGVTTDSNTVPKSGTGTYTGTMLASMINTPNKQFGDPSYAQWIFGTSKTTVDFGAGSVKLALNGTVTEPLLDQRSPAGPLYIPENSTFAANATGSLTGGFTSGFTGNFTDATFTSGGTVIEHLTPPTSVDEVVNNRVLPEIVMAASTFDGNFYGPKGEEVGGGFRIIGGNPEQRIDIVGAFTGKGN